MRVTGPAAQFGRGVMQDVSAKLMKRFADCLAEQLSGGGERGAGRGARRGAAGRGGDRRPRRSAESVAERLERHLDRRGRAGGPERVVRRVQRQAAEARRSRAQAEDVLDLGEASRDAVLKRAIPVVAAVGALLILLRIIRR